MFEQLRTRSHTRYRDADRRFHNSGTPSAKSYPREACRMERGVRHCHDQVVGVCNVRIPHGSLVAICSCPVIKRKSTHNTSSISTQSEIITLNRKGLMLYTVPVEKIRKTPILRPLGGLSFEIAGKGRTKRNTSLNKLTIPDVIPSICIGPAELPHLGLVMPAMYDARSCPPRGPQITPFVMPTPTWYSPVVTMPKYTSRPMYASGRNAWNIRLKTPSLISHTRGPEVTRMKDSCSED
jgi:hypothetical protein